MATLFCPKCGKDTDIFFVNICRECFVGNRSLIECPAVLNSRICPTCGSVFKKGRWFVREDEKSVIRECAKESLKTDVEASNLVLKLTPEQIDYSRYRVHIEASGNIKGAPVDAVTETEVRISWETCDTCSRISGGYFEGIVQIRADKRIPTEEELKKCIAVAEDVALHSQEKGERLAFIAKTVKIDEGFDIYVGLNRLGKQICKAIVNVFGGKYKESPKLVGQKNGEDLYRITFALRLPEFVRGDIISVDNKVIEVLSCGKHVSGLDLETGKRFIENFDDLMDIRKLGRIADMAQAVYVADEGRTIQVMDPVTYESVTIKKPEFLNARPGDNINIIKTSKGIYMVP